jgi:hypothetical protein
VAHIPAFLKKNKINVSTIPNNIATLNQKAFEKFGIQPVISDYANYQLYLNHHVIESANKNKEEITAFLVKELNEIPHILIAFSYDRIDDALLPADTREMFLKGFNKKLGGDIQVVLKAGYFYGGTSGTTHGSWYPYDSHIPMVWMGWGIPHGKTHRPTHMSDIAPTLSALLQIQMPNGSIGRPVTEILPTQ